MVTFTLSARASGARAGHHLIVAAPLGQDPRREYSLSAIRADELEITVKREGVVSRWLHSTVQPGDSLTASAPRGSFLLGDQDVPVVLLSCGIGITPMMAMAQEALDRGREVRFVHVARDRAHHAFREEIGRLGSADGFSSHVTYKHGADTTECDHVGEFTVEQLREVLPDSAVEVKICGPSRFMEAMYDAVVELGVPTENIAWEAFGPSTLTPRAVRQAAPHQEDGGTADSAATAETQRVTFVDSQLTVQWDPAAPNLLDFAEEHGVYPNYSCRQGSCESCTTRVVKGEFEYVDDPFELPGEGFVLLCCSRPVTDIELAI